MKETKSNKFHSRRKIRYAVVGLGHIAQVAVLPAFKHAKENSTLAALVSGDERKLKSLGKKYGAKDLFTYKQYEACLQSGLIDAVYIALPNHLHREYAEMAAKNGIHVLCEKPMALNSAECASMIAAATEHDVKLMIAYRLHFEKANLEAIRIAKSGKLGDVRSFDSTFSFQVKDRNIRVRKESGGGTVPDIGVYCINAARAVFGAEPVEVVAFSTKGADKRFTEVDEMTAAIIRFPEGRLATFTSSFNTEYSARYDILGTKGRLRVEPAYGYDEPIRHELTARGMTTTRKFSKRDQFGPELLYFSKCILEDRDPEPSGVEGMADVRIIEAIYRSARKGMPVRLAPLERDQAPSPRNEITRPPIREPEPLRVAAPAQGD
jgi:predicted dehydrogenase